MAIAYARALRRLILGAAFGVLPIVAGAQGNADEGVTPDAIRIGMFGPLTGPTAIGSLPLLGAEAIYKSVNDRGGIHGRKIELFVEDDACDPNKSIAATKKLISQERVFMIHGGWCSATVMGIKPELAANPDLPYMVLGAASAAISTPVQANIFHPIATTATVAKELVDFALSVPNAKRIAIIGHTDEWGKSHLDPAVAELTARGMQPVAVEALERGQVDATAQTLRIRGAKPDAVLAILYQPELTIYLRAAHKYGIKIPTITTQGVSIEDMVKRVAIPAATSQLFVFYPLADTLGSADFKPWVDIYRTYNPKEPVETLSFMGMTGALAVVEALEKSGPDLTRERFMVELNRLKDFDPGIQSGPLTFTPEQHAGISSGKMIYMPDGKQARIVSQYPASN